MKVYRHTVINQVKDKQVEDPKFYYYYFWVYK